MPLILAESSPTVRLMLAECGMLCPGRKAPTIDRNSLDGCDTSITFTRIVTMPTIEYKVEPVFSFPEPKPRATISLFHTLSPSVKTLLPAV